MSASLPEFVEKLVLDGTKVGFWPERIKAWERGERIAPVTIDCAMTRACNAACHFCVHPDSLIEMADGTHKRMIDVMVGEAIRSVDPYGRLTESVVTHHWMTSASSPVITIETSAGSLTCTPDHLVLTEVGWTRAGNIKEGNYVYSSVPSKRHTTKSPTARQALHPQPHVQRRNEMPHKNANPEPYEEQGDRSKGCQDKKEKVRRGSLLQPLQGLSKTRKTQASYAYSRGKRGVQPAYAGGQPNAQGRGRAEGSEELYSRAQEASVRAYEENVGGRQDCSQHVLRQRKRQESQLYRDLGFICATRPRSEVRRGRHVLVGRDKERCAQESRLPLRQRERQDSSTGSRKVLAPRHRKSERRDTGLLERRLESTRGMDRQATYQQKAQEPEGKGSTLASLCRVKRIRYSGVSAVYDLECYPHHNFVADGAVVHNCYAQLQASESEIKVTRDHFLSFLEDAAEIGVKGVSFISDGESTVVPWWADAVHHGHSCGLCIGAGSNGIKLTRPVLEKALPYLTYLRFNFSAGERKRYAEIMGVPQSDYDTVVRNIHDGMDIINGHNLSCTLNMQMVCDPKDADQILPFARLVAELKPSYGIIKHCADSIDHSLKVDYSKYDALQETFEQAEDIGRRAGVRITVKKSRMSGKREYHQCFGPPFIMQVSGNGLVAPCGFLFNERYKAFHIGNITRQRFKDIWESDRYMEVMSYLGSKYFDPSVRCGPNCLQHSTNQFLWEYKNGRVELPLTPPPPHLGFL